MMIYWRSEDCLGNLPTFEVMITKRVFRQRLGQYYAPRYTCSTWAKDIILPGASHSNGGSGVLSGTLLCIGTAFPPLELCLNKVSLFSRYGPLHRHDNTSSC